MTGLDSLVPMIHVKSVPRSIEFYGKLGFSVGNTFTPPGQVEPSWAWLVSGGARLMLARAGELVGPSPQALLFYLYCEDVAAYRSRLRNQGVEVGEIEYPFYSPRGEFRVTDPDGFALIVSHT
ncbi:MAG TPA: VOC family protein [Candidatus Polarisedimenticolia bacterium]